MVSPKLLVIIFGLLPALALAQELPAPVEPPVVEWKPNFKWSGDLRYRMARAKEAIDQERKFQQIRARLGMRADVNESVQAVIRMATATSAISNNQTLGDSNEPGMTRRGFGLDQAYLDWNFLESGKFWAGRTANPFWAPNKTQLVFDADLAFEGLALKWEPTWSRTGAFINIGGFIVSENYSSGADSVDLGIVGGDVGWIWKRSGFSWTTHAGNYYFLNVQNSVITRVDKDARIDPYSYPFDRYRGNTVYVNDPLLPAADRKYYFQSEYVLLEAGTEFRHKLGSVEYWVFGDFVRNSKVGHLGQAYEYGAGLKWKWISYTETVIVKESDSVLGAFTDSDANGGGTDTRGSRRSLAFQLGKNTTFSATQYNATRGVDTVSRKYSGTHVDLSVSF